MSMPWVAAIVVARERAASASQGLPIRAALAARARSFWTIEVLEEVMAAGLSCPARTQ
jgi:hypothetical protein